MGDKGSTFKLGEELNVKVAGVNMDLLQIDFALVEKVDDEKMAKPTKRKMSGKKR